MKFETEVKEKKRPITKVQERSPLIEKEEEMPVPNTPEPKLLHDRLDSKNQISYFQAGN